MPQRSYSRRVLLIEDDAAHAELIRRELAQLPEQIHVDVAPDGPEALRMLARALSNSPSRQAWPALVLLDLRLPGMDGFEVLRRCRTELGLRTPVVVLSTSATDADIRRAYELGANAYLVKPMSLEDFVKLADSVADFWLARNEPPPVEVSRGNA